MSTTAAPQFVTAYIILHSGLEKTVPFPLRDQSDQPLQPGEAKAFKEHFNVPGREPPGLHAFL